MRPDARRRAGRRRPVGPYVQSERRDLYGIREAAVRARPRLLLLLRKGDEEETPEARRAKSKSTICACRDLPWRRGKKRVEAGEPFVIRQRIPHEGTTTFHDATFGDITVENKELDDQVLLKADGLPTYNFANVVDDHLMGITHVVRGSEYLSSAPKYNLLYEAFGWEIPTYVHCSPVMRDAQHKMSKRHGDPSYEDLIAQGYLTEAGAQLCGAAGLEPEGRARSANSTRSTSRSRRRSVTDVGLPLAGTHLPSTFSTRRAE